MLVFNSQGLCVDVHENQDKSKSLLDIQLQCNYKYKYCYTDCCHCILRDDCNACYITHNTTEINKLFKIGK